MAIVAWCDFRSSEIMNKSGSWAGTELSVSRLRQIDGLDGVHVLAVMLVWISRIFIAAPKLLGQNWCRVFTRGGYLGVKGFLCKGGS